MTQGPSYFQKWWQKWAATWKRMRLDSYLTQYRKKKKIDTEWAKNLYVRVDTVKLLAQSSLASILISLDSFVFRFDTKSSSNNSDINKWNYIWFKRFWTGKEIINQMKRQPREHEKIFGNNAFDKRLICEIYQKVMKLNNTVIIITQF